MSHTEKAEKISITLPHDMLTTIKNNVSSGAYASNSELIREAMRLWQKKDEEYQLRIALIRERLDKSAASGEPVPLDEAFNRIEQKHKSRLDQSNL